LHALQLMQQVLQAVVLRQRLFPLGNCRIALRKRRRKLRLQHCNIGRKLICVLAHVQPESDSSAGYDGKSAA
jgi:hypothetical protein